MKKFKKLSFVFITVILCLIIASSSVSAATYDAGSFEEGIIAATDGYGFYAPTYQGNHPNFDFEQGLKYWTSPKKGYGANMYAEVKTEGDNTYMVLGNGDAVAYAGVYSVRFTENKAQEGDKIVAICDWRGTDKNFQLVVYQMLDDKNGNSVDRFRVNSSAGGSVDLKTASSDDEWNTICEISFPEAVKKPDKGCTDYVFEVWIQLRADPTTIVDIDNIRLAKYSEASRKIHDFDGNLLFDLNDLNSDDGPIEYNEAIYGDIVVDADKKGQVAKPDSPYGSIENAPKSDNNSNNNESEDFIGSTAFGVVIACCAVIILAGTALTVVLIKKKKSTVSEETEN